MKAELIEFLQKAKSIKPNWSITELIERENEINSIDSEPQIEARSVSENEVEKEDCSMCKYYRGLHYRCCPCCSEVL